MNDQERFNYVERAIRSGMGKPADTGCESARPLSPTEVALNQLDVALAELTQAESGLFEALQPVRVNAPPLDPEETKAVQATIPRSPLVNRINNATDQVQLVINRISQLRSLLEI